MLYVFDDYTVDTQCETLYHKDEAIPLEPRPFKLLVYLLRHRDRLVERQELFDHLWLDVVVSDDALQQCVTAVRRALGDSGRTQRYIQTRTSRGYRFVQPVKEDAFDPSGDERQGVPLRPSFPVTPAVPPALDQRIQHQRAAHPTSAPAVDTLHAPAPTPQRGLENPRAPVNPDDIMTPSSETVQPASELPEENSKSNTARRNRLRPRRILWLACAVGFLTVCGVGLWLQVLQRPQERPLQALAPEARLPAVEAPAAPVVPEQAQAPAPEVRSPEAEAPAAPMVPEQAQSPRTEEIHDQCVTALQAAGFWCRRPRQSPCLRDVTVRDTGEVRPTGVLCDRQDADQVQSLLEPLPGVSKVVMEDVNFPRTWNKDYVPPGCDVRPWHKPSGSTP